MNLPRILLIATGGTIAMQPRAHGDGADASLDARTIAGEQASVALELRDLFSRPSASIGLSDIALIAVAIDEAQAAGVTGVVVTHGTDTLAETGFALALMGRWDIPVVLTGAMRHAGLPGADGPGNVAAAIALASDPAAAIGEPLIVFGDEIHLASLIFKQHGARLHAFSSAPLGPIGAMREGRAEILLRPTRALPHLPLAGPVPTVPMLLVGNDLEPESVMAFAGDDFAGLVVAAVGGGHVSARAVPALERLAQHKPVVLASRCEGGVLRATYGYDGGEMDLEERGLMGAGRWRPEQARIMLQLLIAGGAGHGAIEGTFSNFG